MEPVGLKGSIEKEDQISNLGLEVLILTCKTFSVGFVNFLRFETDDFDKENTSSQIASKIRKPEFSNKNKSNRN